MGTHVILILCFSHIYTWVGVRNPLD